VPRHPGTHAIPFDVTLPELSEWAAMAFTVLGTQGAEVPADAGVS
jgi:hypothetical protein